MRPLFRRTYLTPPLVMDENKWLYNAVSVMTVTEKCGFGQSILRCDFTQLSWHLIWKKKKKEEEEESLISSDFFSLSNN